jgi:hypothetical protein
MEIEVTGPPPEVGYCHCHSCRWYSGAQVSAYILRPAANVRITKGASFVGHFNKVGISDRQHCSKCGGLLMTAHPTMGLTDVRPALIPGIAFAPTVHPHYGAHVLAMKGGLTKLKDFPKEAGGSDAVVPE